MAHAAVHPILAGLGATVIGSLIGAVLLTIAGFGGSVESGGHFIGSVAAIAFYGFIVALPFVYLYGMPLYAVLRKFDAANLGTGIVVGILPGLMWILWTHGNWIDAVLWIGTLIAIAYVYLRRWHGTPSNRTVQTDARESGPRGSP